jgi:hypothetical protein
MYEKVTIQFPTVALTENTYRYYEVCFLLLPVCGEATAVSSMQELQYIQSVQLKSGPYFNINNLFTKIYNMLYYTTNLYLQ